MLMMFCNSKEKSIEQGKLFLEQIQIEMKKDAVKKDLFLSIVNQYVGISNNKDKYIKEGLKHGNYAKVLADVFEKVPLCYFDSKAKLAFAIKPLDASLSVSLQKKCFEEIKENLSSPKDPEFAKDIYLPIARMIYKNLQSFNNNREAQKLAKKINEWEFMFVHGVTKEEAELARVRRKYR